MSKVQIRFIVEGDNGKNPEEHGYEKWTERDTVECESGEEVSTIAFLHDKMQKEYKKKKSGRKGIIYAATIDNVVPVEPLKTTKI